MTCTCGETFKATDSTGSDHGLCQDCWEALCSGEWWQAVNAIGGEDEDRLHS